MRKENGIWHFEENWFLKYVWGINFWILLVNLARSWENMKLESPGYPKTLCSLFWGSLAGLIFIPVSVAFALATICLIGAFFLGVGIMGAFFGFYLRSFRSEKVFYPYKHWKEKRIPVVAWQVCIPGLIIYVIWEYHAALWKFLAAAPGGFVSTAQAVINFPGFFGWLCFAAGILTFLLLKSTPGKVFREYIKAAKKKMCPLVVIDIKPKE